MASLRVADILERKMAAERAPSPTAGKLLPDPRRDLPSLPARVAALDPRVAGRALSNYHAARKVHVPRDKDSPTTYRDGEFFRPDTVDRPQRLITRDRRFVAALMTEAARSTRTVTNAQASYGAGRGASHTFSCVCSDMRWISLQDDARKRQDGARASYLLERAIDAPSVERAALDKARAERDAMRITIVQLRDRMRENLAHMKKFAQGSPDYMTLRHGATALQRALENAEQKLAGLDLAVETAKQAVRDSERVSRALLQEKHGASGKVIVADDHAPSDTTRATWYAPSGHVAIALRTLRAQHPKGSGYDFREVAHTRTDPDMDRVMRGQRGINYPVLLENDVKAALIAAEITYAERMGGFTDTVIGAKTPSMTDRSQAGALLTPEYLAARARTRKAQSEVARMRTAHLAAVQGGNHE